MTKKSKSGRSSRKPVKYPDAIRMLPEIEQRRTASAEAFRQAD
jgi:hypothetical protein